MFAIPCPGLHTEKNPKCRRELCPVWLNASKKGHGFRVVVPVRVLSQRLAADDVGSRDASQDVQADPGVDPLRVLETLILG